jgi:hypothetical protein
MPTPRAVLLLSLSLFSSACSGERFDLAADAGSSSGGGGGSGGATGGGGGASGATGGGGGASGAGAGPATCHGVEFDGTDDWISVPDAAELDAIAPITVEAWIKAASYPSEVQIVSHHDHNAQTGWVLLIFQGSEMQFRYQFGGSINSSGFTPVSAGTWHHVAATCDAGVVRLFVDGAQVHQGNIPTGVAEDYSGPLAIGRAAYTDGFHFLGIIDDVRISNVARYTSDFTPAHSFSPDANTVALWDFEGQGQLVKDATGMHDGTLGADQASASDDPVRVQVPCEH